MPITITATNAGFHSLTGTGAPVAPDLFLGGFLDVTGTAGPLGNGETWGIDMPGGWVRLENVAPLGQAQESVVEVAFDSVHFGRTEDGATVAGGQIALDSPLRATTLVDLDGRVDTAWIDTIGDALQERVQHEGLRFVGGTGRDFVDLSDHPYPIYGEVVLLGRGGDDRLESGRTDARLAGGNGDDVLSTEGGTSVLRGGRGDDTISLGVWSEGSRALGGKGADLIQSSNGPDRLAGGRGDDRLEGGRGNDALNGGHGADMLLGGEGADRFIFNTRQVGEDQILDFETDIDTLVLRGAQKDVSVIQDGNDTVISWDAGGVRILDTTADHFDYL
ncbi:MAG: hypothetical protein AAF813_12625 [Pseudomonadota bacterium]